MTRQPAAACHCLPRSRPPPTTRLELDSPPVRSSLGPFVELAHHSPSPVRLVSSCLGGLSRLAETAAHLRILPHSLHRRPVLATWPEWEHLTGLDGRSRGGWNLEESPGRGEFGSGTRELLRRIGCLPGLCAAFELGDLQQWRAPSRDDLRLVASRDLRFGWTTA
jgi:hypothetical protein